MKALLACNEEMSVIVPEHLSLLKEKCEGKESCVAQACDSFWETELNCASHDKAYMWVHYRYLCALLFQAINRLILSCVGDSSPAETSEIKDMTENCNDDEPGDFPQTESTPYSCEGPRGSSDKKLITKLGNKLHFGCGEGCLEVRSVRK